MNAEKAISFMLEHHNTSFYQPVVFIPGVLEIEGKWHEDTKQLCDLIMNNIKGKSVLDLGCNYGYFLHEAKRKGSAETIGVDHDAIVMEISGQINNIFDDNVTLHSMDIDEYYTAHNFDIVLMLNIIHILPNPLNTIDRYLSATNEKMIIEHEIGYEDNFGSLNYETITSPRAAGQRNLTIIYV